MTTMRLVKSPPNVRCHNPKCLLERFVPLPRGSEHWAFFKAPTCCRCGEWYVHVL